MTARFAWITAAAAAVAVAMTGAALLRTRSSPALLPDLTGKLRRVGRKAARDMADDWDSLFI